MGSLGKKIKKEFLRNSKKTAMLASVSVVAIWFWAPLLWSWLPGKEENIEHSNATANGGEAIESRQQPASASDKKDSMALAFAWQPMIALWEHDSHTKPHPPSEISRNPFAATAQPAMIEIVEEEPIEETPELPFASLGLRLTSTIVGRVFQAARINGETYQRGDVVSRLGMDQENTENTPLELQLRLREIHANFVRLEHRGTLYTLKLKRVRKHVDGEIIMRGERVVAR